MSATMQRVQASYTAGGRSLAARMGGDWLGRKGVPANLVTLTGAAVSMAASVVWLCQIYWPPAFWLGLCVVIPGAWLDAIDGAVAKAQPGGITDFGGLLDSNVDRWVEGVMFAALAAVVAASHGGTWAVFGTVMGLAGSFSVTYARAKGENLGLKGAVGLGGRAERLVLLGLGVLVTKLTIIAEHHGWIGFQLHYEYTAYLIGLLAAYTVAARLLSQRRELNERAKP